MDEEKFLDIFKKARILIDHAKKFDHLLRTGDFYVYYDKYAWGVFADYGKERIYSPGFKLFIEQAMSMVLSMDATSETLLHTNVINFSEAKERLRA